MSEVGQDRAGKPNCAVVFGASGGIGSALCEALVADGIGTVFAGSRNGAAAAADAANPFCFDLRDEQSIAAAAALVKEHKPDLIIVATGILTLNDGTGPERSYRALDADTMVEVLALNAIGPAIIAKHFLPLLPRDKRAVFAALSARVGSISDNGLGGWHSYRASKAALNMLIKNFGIELGRTHKQAVVAALHPGTVDSELSKPFQGNLPDGQLTGPADAARNLLKTLSNLKPGDSGGLFAFDGSRIEP
ncbi:SDR family NAD(P)-dependent oxidoreductase [Pontixanthobacter aestiaquae]|uniref:SDR family NAD(P)-dependent oxidoreductase n=1 Tax=Pontixanthobacter aestiaquae TaxID=1509367 RepID=A0A844Z7B9_9SPHN|nr:SDR family NAD(P)-dependent oxidoreductase [Pontixanthobacter aestiaquae]MDN3645290.1 SDR family NAD(P)-dependent oxidoreductase [Pontixanthobacter aestiaquae]MXO83708.1 SDR family NAD(P)-dependent oxidoreductase [Pontixanthobacter aestiaquae]